ncbi:metal-dependent hydrolase [Halarchaeum nitratireducens]|uniref:Metal-dependent hydrolase n=1 Tax=Halarchaeum nitratireducens TaxID=489913 RepID=A0A830G6W8_9EURY|nr:metal-dependent hydrolase [Halarchaeum nitratireducens]GGN07100.1 hypothetical protein GCM10009021_02660 [Halarchaeum nitratireducens]
MMVTTHAVMGAALVTLLPLSPRVAGVAAFAAFCGGVFPDLDLLVGEHRRTLHYPDYYALCLVPLVGLAGLRPHALTVGLAPRPWLRDDHRGVYCRLGRRWLHPRHWIRWDGAPEDLALCGVCVCVVLFGADRPLRLLAVATLPVSVVYTLLRKRLPDLAPWLVG